MKRNRYIRRHEEEHPLYEGIIKKPADAKVKFIEVKRKSQAGVVYTDYKPLISKIK